MKKDGSPTVWEVLFSIKTFAAAALALFIAFCFGLPNPYRALTTVYIAAPPFSGASTSKTIYAVQNDVLKDLRNGLNVVELQRHKLLLPRAEHASIGEVLAAVATFYQKGSKKAEIAPEDELLHAVR